MLRRDQDLHRYQGLVVLLGGTSVPGLPSVVNLQPEDLRSDRVKFRSVDHSRLPSELVILADPARRRRRVGWLSRIPGL